MTGVETRTVEQADDGQRLDRWFKRHYPALSYGRLAKLLRTGQIRLDGKRAKPASRVATGQEVRVPPLPDTAQAAERTAPQPSAQDIAEIQGRVLYRDDWLIALDKPAGLATQGGSKVGRHLDAMLDALREPGEERPKLVHRLDKDTSGVLLLARSAKAASGLTQAFRDQSTRKLYWALTAGVPTPDAGRIDLPLAKLKRGSGEKMGHAPEQGKPANTLYRTLMTWHRTVAWVALSPLTGRTHQLRAHLHEIDTPILGDAKYAARAAFPEGVEVEQLMLHAREIALPHPGDGTTLRLHAPLPKHMADAFQQLGFDPMQGDGVYPADTV
ncbi:RluA family pseudouridine synthase [Rhodovibrio salinarum]|uniref:Pseudouridine synthase n=1 Tax=Rhodovibrio salinarum TaxID=1087 RepID=A0A934QKY0_9PROT|nr:RluA family pseudouridine synthase [Rhodovibrio salinarum]MBK1698480.1 RluA family pseudouridine synthase [Rhodovibrio salinarum]